MTIPSTTRRAGPYIGTGALVVCSFSFKVFEKTDIQAQLVDTNGNLTRLVLDSSFLVTLNVDQDAHPGGTVQYAVAGVATALPTGYSLTLLGAREYKQNTDLPDGGNFSASDVEDALDASVVLIQQLDERVGRALTLPPQSGASGQLPPPAAGYYLGWDPGGTYLVNLAAPNGGSASALASDLANSTTFTKGAGQIGYGRTVPYTFGSSGWKHQQTPVAVTEFAGVDPTGATDSTTGLQNARDYAALNGKPLVFPPGTYKYTTSPNWAFDNADIRAEGVVLLKCTGTGNALVFDAGTLTNQRVYNVSFRGQFIVEGNASGKNGVYIRSVHHSRIEARVQGCGPTYAAHRIEFSVCSEYWLTASGNEKVVGTSTPAGAGIGFVLGCVPKYGLYLTARNAFEQVSDNIFYNPVHEGVTSDGWYLFGAIMNKFIGGTSEANSGRGVYLSNSDNVTYPGDPVRAKDFASLYNLFLGCDFEVNAGGDIADDGIGNVFQGCYSDSSITFGTTAIRSVLRDGTCNNLTINTGAVGIKVLDVNYANNAGIFTDNGTSTVIRALWNNTGQYFLAEKSLGSLAKTTAGVPTATTTTMLTLPAAEPAVFVSYYHVTAYIPGGVGDPANYAAYALVAVDSGVARVITNIPATRMTISLSGLNVQITQTSGAPAIVTCKASKIG